MFLRRKPIPPPIPCSLQTATFTIWQEESVGNGFWDYVRVETDGSRDSKIGFRATMACPIATTEVSGAICSGKADAVISARRELFKVACSTCPLYGRNPAQIDLYFAERAQAEAARLRAEADLAQARARHADVLAELNESTAAIITPQLAH